MSPATRSTLTLLALLLTSAGVLTLIQTEFNRVVTQPYMVKQTTCTDMTTVCKHCNTGASVQPTRVGVAFLHVAAVHTPEQLDRTASVIASCQAVTVATIILQWRHAGYMLPVLLPLLAVTGAARVCPCHCSFILRPLIAPHCLFADLCDICYAACSACVLIG